jgi:hypothetical protein
MDTLLRAGLLAASCIALYLAPGAAAQETPSPPQPESQPESQPEQDQATSADAANLRARLTRILEHLEGTSATVRTAIEKIDAGGSAAEAIDELGGPMLVRQLSQDWERWHRARVERRPPQAAHPETSPPPDGPPQADLRRVMAFLEEHAPEFAARMAEVRTGSPRRAEVLLGRLGPRVAEILATRERDPALAEIMTREFKVSMELLEVGGQVARARRGGDDARLEELRPALARLAAEQVELRLQRREHEISVLAERIASLREELEQQREEREALIDEVVERASESWRDPPEEERRRQRRGGRD